MDRRRFCWMAAMAVGALSFGSLDSMAESLRRPEGRGVVTVLRRECFAELQSLYLDDPETGHCTLFEPGQQFEVTAGGKCPDIFCPLAWQVLSRCIERATDSGLCALPAGDRHTVIASCPDGTRPVIFKIEL